MLTDPKRVKEIFLGAAEQPDEAARAAYLDRACGDDAGLRDRVEALIRSHDPAGSFLGTPAVNRRDRTGPPRSWELIQRVTPDDDANGYRRPAIPIAAPTGPTRWSGYGIAEMLQVLGRGGFGIVFRAFDEMLGAAWSRSR